MERLLVAGFVATVLGLFEGVAGLDRRDDYEPEVFLVFMIANGFIALALVATGWIAGWLIPHLGRYRFWILPIAWLAWVAAYHVIPNLSMALAALIVFAIAAPDRDPQPLREPPVC